MKGLFITIIIGALVASGCGKEEIPTEAVVEKLEPKAEPEKAAPPEPPSAEEPVAEKAADPTAEKATDSPDTAPTEEKAAADPESDIAAEVGEPLLVKREGFHVAALTLARGIEKTENKKRIPVEQGTSFTIDERRVYAILDIENPNEAEGKIRVGWIWPGESKERNTVSITVKPKKSWRTWAYNGFIKKPGLWQVVLRDEAEGEVIARGSFEMKEGQAEPPSDEAEPPAQ